MDTLKGAEEIDVATVPMGHNLRKSIGRIGELWNRFKALPDGKALKVPCRDTTHAGTTSRAMREKAKAAGVQLGERRVETTYFCWKEKGSP